MKKIQFNATTKEGTQLVCNYVYNHMSNKGMRWHYQALIQPKADALKSITENPLTTLTDAENEELKKKYAVEIANLKAECAKNCEQFAYEATNADKALKRAVKSATDDAQICEALTQWLKQFGITTTTDNVFAVEVVKRGGHKVAYKKFYDTNGEEATEANAANLLKMAYFTLYEALVNVKYIKAVNVPTYMKEHFEAIEARRQARLAAKKADK